MLPPEVQAAKQKAKVKRKPKAAPRTVAAPPPNFPKAIPVRPGAQTNRFKSKPSTQAQRTHVHKARVQRNSLLAAVNQQTALSSAKAAANQALAHPKDLKPVEAPLKKKYAKVQKLDVAKARSGGDLGKLTGINVKKALDNIPKDAAELVTTTPSSVAKLASTAVTKPTKVPGLLAQPYKDLYHDPKTFIEGHPVTAALMLSPGAKMPGRVLGRVARVAGKQTLERPAATLAGTALKETRTGSRDFTIRKMQARKDIKNPSPEMTDKQLGTRVDEFYDQQQQQKSRVAQSAAKEAKTRYKDMPKLERKAAGTEHVKGAKAGAKNTADVRFAEQFGSTWHVNPEGRIVKPKDATKGVLHGDKAHADAIAERVPFEAQVKKVGEQYAVLPKLAVDRLGHHKVVGTSPAIGAKVMRTTGKAFRGAVLPLSAKWLVGQGAEAGVRSAVAGAGPLSLLRERKIFNALEKDRKGAGVEFRQRTSGGGQFGLTGTAREFADGQRTLADEFKGTVFGKPAAAVTKAGEKAPMKAVRHGWKNYTHVVFNVVNNALETTAQRAMAGKAVKTGPLMERHIIGLHDKAIQEAAHGLKGTSNQVALGRQIGRMYGNYSKFSPDKRETLLHTTPFWPWYRNSVTFLTKVLPVDHPVLTAVLADAGKVEEEWRKKHHLSLRDKDHVPMFMMGGVPTKGGKVNRIGRYVPFGAASDPAQSAADLFLPQFSGAQEALRGIDFTGNRMKYPGYKGREFNLGERALAALTSEASVLAPGIGQAGRITGAVPKYVEHKNKKASLKPKDLLKAANKEFNPTLPTGSGNKPKVKKKRKKKAAAGPLGGGSSTGGPLF